MPPSRLVLEDGTAYEGESFGSTADTIGEVVFNTSLTGYQEIATDPSYRFQIVVMTYPHIGNYGVEKQVAQSDEPQVAGRSEEHTSELQSRLHLVCRLLLEKKKNNKQQNNDKQDNI